MYRLEIYNFYDLLASLGGLGAALTLLANTVLIPINSWTVNAELLSSMFRWRASYKKEDTVVNGHEINPTSRSPRLSFNKRKRLEEDEGQLITQMNHDFN